ncbi:MAG: hypothetical protein R3A80_02875 [Bdellovibrionota bacterium]
MEKDINLTRTQIANFTTSALSFFALFVIFLMSCKQYGVTDVDSPALILAMMTTLPYLITAFFTFFCKTSAHRKAFYATLGVLFLMTGAEWVLPKSILLRDVYSVVWFFQTIVAIPFLIVTIKNQSGDE